MKPRTRWYSNTAGSATPPCHCSGRNARSAALRLCSLHQTLDFPDSQCAVALVLLGRPSLPLGNRVKKCPAAFSLIELLVATAVFALLLVLITMLFNNANALSTLSTKHLDADAQARLLLDRMAVDFSQMIKRRDVDCFLKSASNQMIGGSGKSPNDQIAFFSEVPGYYPSTTAQSPVSLVAYRINASNSMERLGKGLLWNGASSGNPMVFLPLTIAATWPAATDATADTDYEPMGSDIFRFEYFYLLKDGTLSITGAISDVAGIGVAIAVIDPKSRVLVSDSQLEALAAQMEDFAATMKPGDLEKNWQSAIESSTLPRAVIPSIHVYGRIFYLNQPPA